MYSESISNGFIIDDTPPTVVTPPTKKNKLESLNKAFSRTAMSFEWEFSDNESSVEHHYLSISSHQLGEFNPSVLKVLHSLTLGLPGTAIICKFLLHHLKMVMF